MNDHLDNYDKKILYFLDIDSRQPVSAIAKKVKLPKETVHYRLKRIVANKYVDQFYTIIDPAAFGLQYYKVNIKFHKLPTEVENDITDFIMHSHNCATLRFVEGPFSITFLSVNKHPHELKSFMHDFSQRYGDYIRKKRINTVITTYRFNEKILLEGDSFKQTMYHGNMTNVNHVDDIDYKILQVLATDARMKTTEIAQKIKEDPQTVRYRIKVLEDKNVIRGYGITLNLPELHLQYIQVDISLKNLNHIMPLISFFDSTNTCLYAHEFLGRNDLSVDLAVRNDAHLREILLSFKEKFIDYYLSYEVSHIYKEMKPNWAPFIDKGSRRKDQATLKQFNKS